MKYRPLWTLLIGAAFACPAFAQQINPITRAMLNGYNELLKENPKDYVTLYDRAAQYYQLSRYDDAQNDLIKAIEYTPAKERDLRLSELTLMADVATETKNYDLALRSIDEALALDPGNYANVYKKGNILLYLDRPEDAYRIFSSMQSLKSRSQEAYFGMAKACIRQQKFSEAEDLMKEAENADPTNYLTYCRIGDLFMDMEQPENAATNYLVAFNLSNSKSDSRPLDSLIGLAASNYGAVATALDFAIEKSTNKIPNLFLKGNIACESGNFSQADAAFTQLLAYPEACIPAVYAQQARTKLGENKLDEAKEAISNAIKLDAGADYYLVKSRIELGLGNPAQAVIDASNAMNAGAVAASTLTAKAEAQIALGDSKGALESVNEAIMMAPDDSRALLLRAYINDNLTNNGKAAIGDFNRIILQDAESFPELTYKAIAQAKAGKKIDADETVRKGLEANSDKDSYYWGAVYYAQTGDLDKAKETLDKAIYNGYQNQYEILTVNTPWLSIAPIRHLYK